MAALDFLWRERAKFPVGSKSFFRAWGKRIISFPELTRRNNRRKRLVRSGAMIHAVAEIGNLRFDGNKKNLTVGKHSFIGNVYMAGHAPILIGAKVCINDDVRILTASHDVMDPQWRHVKAEVIIEDYAWIGTGAMILPGVKIGRGAVVGAGSVVTRSVMAGAIVVGNPAKPTDKKRVEDLNYNPCEFLAANRAWLIG